ncbi:hypothetical protein BHE97_04735 [Aeromicrobium sp. PE09-221]|nr:hypothetical protein BHE97_04735 [Aeromicrobium sp. PE09-221]
MPIPADHARWWSTTMPVWRTSVDVLGHMTAAHYAAIYEEVSMEFFSAITGQEDPSYVNAQTTIDYRREVLHRLSPIEIRVAITRMDDSSFEMTMVLLNREQSVCSMARNHYVAWDRFERGRRSLTASEYRALQEHLAIQQE